MGEADDRIIAILDGALVLITNTKSDPKSRIIWSLQSAALGFEVLGFLCQSLTVGEKGGCALGGVIDEARFS